jgi:hypothetical protein
MGLHNKQLEDWYFNLPLIVVPSSKPWALMPLRWKLAHLNLIWKYLAESKYNFRTTHALTPQIVARLERKHMPQTYMGKTRFDPNLGELLGALIPKCNNNIKIKSSQSPSTREETTSQSHPIFFHYYLLGIHKFFSREYRGSHISRYTRILDVNDKIWDTKS